MGKGFREAGEKEVEASVSRETGEGQEGGVARVSGCIWLLISWNQHRGMIGMELSLVYLPQ